MCVDLPLTISVDAFSLLSLPLDERFVLPSNGEHALGVGRKGCANHMLAMTRVANCGMRVVDGWVVVHVDETPIVAGYKQGLVGTSLNLVNMRAIFTRWMHSLDSPA